MLCSRFKQIIFSNSSLNNNVQYRYLIASRSISKRCFRIDEILASIARRDSNSMSAFRLILKDLVVRRLWSAWTRSTIVHSVVRRCRRDRSVRDVLQRFRQAIFSPRRTLLLSATAAFKARHDDDEPPEPPRSDDHITDDEIESLLLELDRVEVLSRNTLYCTGCGKRLAIDKKHHAGVRYCTCKEPQHPEVVDGWVPYMEAEDVIIWRKEYKSGQGLYAYKVYGRYKDVRAEDFAAVQLDGAYRRVWDSAVAALSVVERSAHGVRDQAVLHWEVMWPRLFANRDYVYIRRHREFDLKTRCVPHKEADGLFPSEPSEPREGESQPDERPSVHSNAKRKAREADLRERETDTFRDNKVYVIVSKSCEHHNAPETKHAIRVSEYWSHMVVKTIDGPEKVGMEFVLTYYDEPAVGGLPSGVASWATGRAAPQYLQRMRTAAADYTIWRRNQPEQELPDYTPFGLEKESFEPETSIEVQVSEQDMESSKSGPELENSGTSGTTREQSTQTDIPCRDVTLDKCVDTSDALKENSVADEDNEKLPEEAENNGGWWRYLYPFYYFL